MPRIYKSWNKGNQNNKKSRIKRRSNKKSLRKRWAKSLEGKSPLPRAGSPRKQTYTQLKSEYKIEPGLPVGPEKIFPNAPSIDFRDTLRNWLIHETDYTLIKLIKDDMVRILVNYKGIFQINDEHILEDSLHGNNYKDKLFTDSELDNYMKLFKTTKTTKTTKEGIRKLSESVFQ